MSNHTTFVLFKKEINLDTEEPHMQFHSFFRHRKKKQKKKRFDTDGLNTDLILLFKNDLYFFFSEMKSQKVKVKKKIKI